MSERDFADLAISMPLDELKQRQFMTLLGGAAADMDSEAAYRILVRIKSQPRCASSEYAMILHRKAVRMADRIVKLTTAIVALLFSATAVLAQDRLTKEDLTTLAVTLGVYDNRCEKLAPRLLADLQRMVRMLDKDDVMARVVVEQEKVDEAGEAKWCGAYRPVVEKYKEGLFEPPR